MTVVRRLARPMLGSVFIWGGAEALLNPGPKEPAADRVGPSIARKIPYLPEDPESLVRINAAVQLAAGSLLALGRTPRLASALLAGSLVPTTLAGHRFWEEKDPQERYRQRGNFLKNVGLLGGLILAAVDTEGRPGVAWRAKHATHHAADSTRRARRTAKREARLAAHAARAKLPS